MVKRVREVRFIARRHSQAAIMALARILRSHRPPATARIAAANALLDRGWGKPKPEPAIDENEAAAAAGPEADKA